MKLDKKQMPRVIVLGVLIVLVVGFGLFRIMGTRTSASTPSNPSKTGTRKTNEAGTGTQQTDAARPSVQVASEPEEPQVVITPSGPKRDPFAPVDISSAPIAPGREQIKASVMARNPMSIANPALPPLMPIGPGGKAGLPSLLTPGTPLAGRAPSAPRQQADLKLTGVVGNGHRLAILRGNGEERYFVRRGDRVGGQYQVAAITPYSVTLSGAEGKVVLKLEDSKQESRPTR